MRRRALDLVGLHCHIGSQLFELEVYPAAPRRSWPTSRADDPVMDMGGGLGIAYTQATSPAAVDDYAEAVGGRGARVSRRCRGSWWSRAASSWAAPASPCTGSAPSRDPGRAHLRRGGRRHERPAAAHALRRGLRGPARRPRAAERLTSPASTARRATSGPRRVARPPGRGDVLVPPATGAYGVSMASNYNGVTRPAVVFCRTARPVW